VATKAGALDLATDETTPSNLAQNKNLEEELLKSTFYGAMS